VTHVTHSVTLWASKLIPVTSYKRPSVRCRWQLEAARPGRSNSRVSQCARLARSASRSIVGPLCRRDVSVFQRCTQLLSDSTGGHKPTEINPMTYPLLLPWHRTWREIFLNENWHQSVDLLTGTCTSTCDLILVAKRIFVVFNFFWLAFRLVVCS